MPQEIEYLREIAGIAEDVEGYLDITDGMEGVEVWTPNAAGDIRTFRYDVDQVIRKNPEVSLAGVVERGRELLDTLEKEISEFFPRKLEEFMSLAASFRKECSGLYAPRSQEIENALIRFTAAVNTAEHHDEIAPSFLVCSDISILLCSLLEAAKKEAEAARVAAAEEKEAAGLRTRLQSFVRRVA